MERTDRSVVFASICSFFFQRENNKSMFTRYIRIFLHLFVFAISVSLINFVTAAASMSSLSEGPTTSPPMSQKRGASVLVAGATGAIGREFILKTVADDAFSQIVALSRRDISEAEWADTWPGIDMDKARAKLTVYGVDWEGLCDPKKAAKSKNAVAAFFPHLSTAENSEESSKKRIPHDFAVNLMGSTRKDAGSAEAFHRFDYDYYEAFVKAVMGFPVGKDDDDAKKYQFAQTVTHISQISSTGASATSWFLYLKTKGAADEMLMRHAAAAAAVAGTTNNNSAPTTDAQQQQPTREEQGSAAFQHVSIWRPGLLARKDKARFVEKIGGLFSSAMPVERVAAAIVEDLKNPKKGEKIGEVPSFPSSTAAGGAATPTIRIFSNDGINRLTPDWPKEGSGCCTSEGRSGVKDTPDKRPQHRSDL